MNDFTINEMLSMQKELQEKYKDKWESVTPKNGKNKLLWMICEVGEVIDIIKKKGSTQIMEDSEVRKDFIEEMSDVLMFYNDILLCYGITPEELKNVYIGKFERNMKRW